MMRYRSNRPLIAVLFCVLQLVLCLAAQSSQAQTRKPTAKEIAAIRDCATRNKDDLDEGERQCLFTLVAEPCTNKPPGQAADAVVADCYRLEASIWDGLLNDNYKSLLATLE